MCGILGLYGMNDRQRVRKASELLVHRGPDMHGAFSDKNIELFHRRLSIIDLSEKGRQPMSNEDGTIWITYNGEIYNYQELKESLQKKHEFKTSTDTEVIIHLYEELKEDCVKHLEGDFAFALWDKNTKQLFLARDRIGVKPLYYTKQPNNIFIFGSEYKAILPFLQKIEINKQALSDYVTWGFNLNDETMVKGIFSLPPAHTLTITKDKIKLKKYWDLEKEKKKENIRELLKQAVKKRLIGDVPLGVYLSGGLDSSTIVATLSEMTDNIKTFSIAFDSEDVLDESIYAEQVAKKFNTEHTTFTLDEKACKYFPKILWHLDEPISALSVIPLYVLSQNAKKKATIVLSGNGGDECFAGYRQHQITYLAYKYAHHIPNKALSKISSIATMLSKEPRKKEFIKNFLRNAKEPNKSYAEFVLKDMPTHEKSELLGFSKKPATRFINLKKDNLLNDLKYIDLRYRAANNYLLSDDKVNMASSIESRVPFFDHKLIEAAWALKPEQQVSLFDKKIYLKKLMKNKLPKEVISRKKYGFTSPLKQWFNNHFSQYQNLIHETRLFNKETLSNYLKDYENDNKKINILFCLTTLGIWHKIFIENKGKIPQKLQ